MNNAGVMAQERVITVLLTQKLLKPLLESKQGRIINVVSNVYGMGKFDAAHLGSTEGKFSPIAAYATSKLLLTMWTVELAERLRHTRVTVNALHPGIVRTQMMLAATGVFKLIALIARPFSISAQQSAETAAFLALSPDLGGSSGKYFERSKPVELKAKFLSTEDRRALWLATAARLHSYFAGGDLPFSVTLDQYIAAHADTIEAIRSSSRAARSR